MVWGRAREAKARGSMMALQASGCKLKGMRQPNKLEQELLTTCLNIQDNTSMLGWCPSTTALLTHSPSHKGYRRERERETKDWIHLNTAAVTAKGRRPHFHSQVSPSSLQFIQHGFRVSLVFPINFLQGKMFWIHFTNGPQQAEGCTPTLGNNQAELT